MIIYCQTCGRPFEDGKPERCHGSHLKFCASCREERKHRWKATKATKESVERRTEHVNEREQALHDDIRAADAAGMSYGKYMLLKNQAKFQNRA